MSIQQPLVSIITVNYNGNSDTLDFLKSLTQITYPNIEVFVVDNASNVSPDILKESYPFIHLLKSENNLGFAGGNNLAIRQAKGKYFFLLNNDTEVAPDFLEPLVNLMENNEKIGIVSSKLLYFNEPDILQFAGHKGINFYTGRGFAIGFDQKDGPQYQVSYRTFMAHGAAMMISRKAIQKVGLMAELFFLYYEETDFCERVKQAGFEIWFAGQSRVYHKESMSVGKFSPMKIYYMTRNRIIFTRRNTKGFQHYACLIFFMLFSFPKGVMMYLLKGQFKLVKAFVSGVFWNLFHHDIYKNEGLILK